MILIDTSIWLRWLMRKAEEETIASLLRQGAAGGHELVYGELLAGDGGGRARMLSDYKLISWAEHLEHDRVVAWVQQHKLCGCGAGWIDLHLLAAAAAAGWRLWTADARLADLSEQLELDWRP
ncbi:MAG: PIN domain-containing protein [Terriglobales bacterium]